MIVSPQQIVMVPIDEIVPYEQNPKAHPAGQINKLARLIKTYGFKGAILVDKDRVIVSGHGRYLAAKKLRLKEVPVVIDETLTPEQAKAFRIADNKIAESPWLEDKLVDELEQLYIDNVDLRLTAIPMSEIKDLLVDYFPVEKAPDLDRDDEAAGPLYAYEKARKEIRIPAEEEAIEFYEWMRAKNKIYVFFSGGKDSMAVVADLLDHGIDRGKIVLLHCRVPLDYPGLEEFVADFAATAGVQLEVIGPRHTDESLVAVLHRHGLPYSMMSRWCTRKWKIIPMEKWMKETIQPYQKDVVCCEGFRKEEGGQRMHSAQRGINPTTKVYIARPILDYTRQMVIQAITAHGWKLHPVYRYKDRLGCIYCFATKRREWMNLYREDPEIFYKVLRYVAEAAVSEKMTSDVIVHIFRKMLGLPSVAKARKDVGRGD